MYSLVCYSSFLIIKPLSIIIKDSCTNGAHEVDFEFIIKLRCKCSKILIGGKTVICFIDRLTESQKVTSAITMTSATAATAATTKTLTVGKPPNAPPLPGLSREPPPPAPGPQPKRPARLDLNDNNEQVEKRMRSVIGFGLIFRSKKLILRLSKLTSLHLVVENH